MIRHLHLQLIKSCFILLIFFGFAEISNAQYTLTDNDVVVENGIITICSYDFSEKNIVIPETLDGQTVTGIADGKSGDDGIFGYKQISRLQLPSSITAIGNYAFINNSIDTLDFSQCPALVFIGNSAFYNNNIDTLDLSQCSALTYIGDWAFQDNAISGFKLPSPAFSGYTFKNWRAGDNTDFEEEDVVSNFRTSYTAQGSYTLSDDDVVVENGIITRYNTSYCITDLTIPEILDGQTVTGIADRSPGIFADKQISSLQLPSSITTIGNDAFRINNIDTLYLSQCVALTSIGVNAFERNKIDTLDLSQCTALTSIGDWAFNGNNITTLDLSQCAALTSIGDYAFSGNDITTLDLSQSAALSSIGDYAFNGNNIATLDLSQCTALTSIGDLAFYSNNIDTLSLSQCTALTSIGDYAFSGNDITTLDLSQCAALTSIGDYAFSGNDITTLDLSQSAALSSIGDYAFFFNNIDTLDLSQCTALTSIGVSAFYGNSFSAFKLPTTSFSGYTLKNWKADNDTYFEGGEVVSNFNNSYTAQGSYTLSDDDVVVENGIITRYNTGYCITDLTIPEILDGQTVIGIADSHDEAYGIFAYKQISNLQLPSSITTIGTHAFRSNKIDTLDLSQCPALTTIGYRAFYNNKIDTLNLSQSSALTYIGDNAFERNKIDTIDLSQCTVLTYIGDKAFYRNLISEFKLPTPSFSGYTFKNWKTGYSTYLEGGDVVSNFSNSYTAQGSYTLSDDDVVVENGIITRYNTGYCITDLTIPETLDGQTVTGIANGAPGIFANKQISSLRLPSSITTIGNYAFTNNNIDNLDFSQFTALTFIGDRAFFNNDLTNFTLPTPAVSGYIFNNWQNTEGINYNGGRAVSNFETAYTARLNSIDVTFTVTDGTNAIEGATVTFNDTEYTSNTEGKVTIIAVSDGDYLYTATADGYETVNGTVTVVGEDVAESITLSKTAAVENSVSGSFVIYPNPATDYIYIKNANGISAVTLYNALGQQVLQKTSGVARIDVSSLKNGVYILQCTVNGKIQVSHIVIE